MFGITSVIIGQIIAKFKPSLKLIIFLGCLIMSSGIALTYFTVQHSFLMTLFTYGCLNGISNGFTYSTCLSVTMKWFPETKGFSNTLILFGFGLGSAFFNPLITFFINPHNYSPDKSFGNATKNEQDEKYFSAANNLELLNRVPYAFLLTASIYFSIQLIGCLLIFDKNVAIPTDPEKDVKEPLNKQEQIIAIVAKNSLQVAYKDPNEGLKVGEVLKLPAFYLITFMIINYAYASGFILNYYKSFGQAFIENDSYLSIVGSTMSLAGAFGRLLWGFLADKLSFKFCYLIQTTIIVLLVTTIYFTQFISYHNEIFYLIWLFCIFFVSSGIWVNGPTAVMKCFGQKYFTSVYGLVLLINVTFCYFYI